MGLGLGLLSAQRAPDDPRTWTDVYRETLDTAELAEDLGFDSVWTTEHHFVDDGYMPSLLVTSAAIAARTTTIEIGTGVLLAPLHHPLRHAEDAATVQNLSDGRLLLGLGLGWSQVEFSAFGAEMSARGRSMDEILQVLPLAFTGEPFTWSGERYSFPSLGVRPTPDVPIPVLVGGSVDAAVRRAARYADGFFCNASPDRFVHQVQVGLDEMERIGRDPASFSWFFYSILFPTDEPDEALPHTWQQTWKYTDMEASAERSSPIPGAPALDANQTEQVRSRTVAGSSQLIVEHLHSVRDRVDVPVRFVARSYFPTLAYNRQADLLARLARDVLPHV